MAPDLEFRDVSFQYEGAPSPALRDIQLTIDPGEIVLVTGPGGFDERDPHSLSG